MKTLFTIYRLDVLLIIFFFAAANQTTHSLAAEQADSSGHATTTKTDSVINQKQQSQFDSLIAQYDFGYRSTQQHHPMNSYFKDIYRLIYDLRRLFRFVDYSSVRGYESIDELYDISQDFPKNKQTLLIGAAMGGGAVNYLSVLTNRQLARNRIHFLRWKLDKVYLKKSYRFFRFNYYYGYNMRGYGLNIPKYRLYYSHHETDRYISNSYTVWLNRNIGFNYSRVNQYQLFTPLCRTKIGYFAFSYNREASILTSSYEIKKSPRLIIRLYHVCRLDNRYPDRFMGELLFNR